MPTKQLNIKCCNISKYEEHEEVSHPVQSKPGYENIQALQEIGFTLPSKKDKIITKIKWQKQAILIIKWAHKRG